MADGTLRVAVCGAGWCASQHIAAFLHNPSTTVTWLCARDGARARANLDKHGLAQDNEILAQETKLVDTFKAAGMTVIQPDVESFRKPVIASVPAKFEAKWGKGLWERIAAF